jgi:hypothetical protein
MSIPSLPPVFATRYARHVPAPAGVDDIDHAAASYGAPIDPELAQRFRRVAPPGACRVAVLRRERDVAKYQRTGVRADGYVSPEENDLAIRAATDMGLNYDEALDLVRRCR